jgi:hypothetical protein
MDYFEKMYSRRGYHRIAGVDEAGRGPLACLRRASERSFLIQNKFHQKNENSFTKRSLKRPKELALALSARRRSIASIFSRPR